MTSRRPDVPVSYGAYHLSCCFREKWSRKESTASAFRKHKRSRTAALVGWAFHCLFRRAVSTGVPWRTPPEVKCSAPRTVATLPLPCKDSSVVAAFHHARAPLLEFDYHLNALTRGKHNGCALVEEINVGRNSLWEVSCRESHLSFIIFVFNPAR